MDPTQHIRNQTTTTTTKVINKLNETDNNICIYFISATTLEVLQIVLQQLFATRTMQIENQKNKKKTIDFYFFQTIPISTSKFTTNSRRLPIEKKNTFFSLFKKCKNQNNNKVYSASSEAISSDDIERITNEWLACNHICCHRSNV